jgi:hypothetical protein
MSHVSCCMSSCLHGAAHTKGVATEQRSSLILQESFLGTEKWCNKLHCPFVLLAAWVLDALMCEGSCIFAVSPSHGSCSLSPSAPLQRSASCSAQTKCLHGGRVPTVQSCVLITPVKKADLESIPRIPHSGLHCCMAVISFHLTCRTRQSSINKTSHSDWKMLFNLRCWSIWRQSL